MKQRILRWWTYFRRGHGTYLSLILSLANFIVLQYRLLIGYIPMLEVVFTSLTIFVVSVMAVYVPVSILIGWFDYKKGSVSTDQFVGTLADPWRIDIAKALKLMCEGKSDEAKTFLEKWTK